MPAAWGSAEPQPDRAGHGLREPPIDPATKSSPTCALTWPNSGYICRVEVTIRAYDPRDAADLADVFFRSVRQVALSDYTAAQVRAWAPEPRTAEWAHGEASDGRLVLVAANADDRPVAYIDLEPNGHIDRVFCAPEAAGQGIASRLYDAVEAAAREQGIRSLFTEASELARRLFERKGFAVVERQDLVIRGVAIHNYRMAKALDLTAPHLTWPGWPDLNRRPLRPEAKSPCGLAALRHT